MSPDLYCSESDGAEKPCVLHLRILVWRGPFVFATGLGWVGYISLYLIENNLYFYMQSQVLKKACFKTCTQSLFFFFFSSHFNFIFHRRLTELTIIGKTYTCTAL